MIVVQEDLTPKRVIEIVEMLKRGESPPVRLLLLLLNFCNGCLDGVISVILMVV